MCVHNDPLWLKVTLWVCAASIVACTLIAQVQGAA